MKTVYRSRQTDRQDNRQVLTLRTVYRSRQTDRQDNRQVLTSKTVYRSRRRSPHNWLGNKRRIQNTNQNGKKKPFSF